MESPDRSGPFTKDDSDAAPPVPRTATRNAATQAARSWSVMALGTLDLSVCVRSSTRSAKTRV